MFLFTKKGGFLQKFIFGFYPPQKWPSRKQWAGIFKVLTKKERAALLIFSALFFGSAFFLTMSFYLKNTETKPDFGGDYAEGLLGSPRFINPIYSAINDTDRDLVELIFSGLLKYDGNGQILPDLAECNVEEEGTLYKCYLKENVLWHDGKKVTADDVLFTIKTIQNPDYKSPLRANWLGVELEKISDREIHFKLKKPYGAFLERLIIKILPEHIWQNISPQNFPLATYNLQPVGSGPYQFKKIKQTESGSIAYLELQRFENYFGKKPYLTRLNFHFFETEDALIKSANKRELKGFSIGSFKNYDSIQKNGFNEYLLPLPRYFAAFLNPDKSKFLAVLEIRQAINYGIDKEEIVKSALRGKGEVAESPIMPEIYGFEPPSKIYEFNPQKAKELLAKSGFSPDENGIMAKVIKKEPAFQFKSDLLERSRGKEVEELQKCLLREPGVYPGGEVTGLFGPKTKAAVILFQEKYAKDILEPWGFEKGTGLVSKSTRGKLNELCGGIAKEETERLSFSLTTAEDPTLKEVAEQLKNQLKKVGIEIKIETYPVSQLEQNFIKPRNYEILLFGEVLGAIPDPYPFWHSSQKKDPGLNLSKYEDKTADKLLEEARISSDPSDRAEKYQEFQDVLIGDSPGVFLYSSDYVYFVSGEIKGIEAKMIVDPSKRFASIENWHLKTKRDWK